MERKESKASMILGILSICLFWLTWPGMILAIIGLCIDKRIMQRKSDIALNIIGLVLSSLWLILALSIMGY